MYIDLFLTITSIFYILSRNKCFVTCNLLCLCENKNEGLFINEQGKSVLVKSARKVIQEQTKIWT